MAGRRPSALFALLWLLGQGVAALDRGFHLLHSSNVHEFHEQRIRFASPLPDWLNGTLLRNGPGRFEMGAHSLIHSFDGYSKISRVSLRPGGTSTFSTQFLGTASFNESMRRGDIAPFLLFDGVQPAFSAADKLHSLLRGVDNMNVNVIRMGQHYVALNDFWRMYGFDPSHPSCAFRIEAAHPSVSSPLSFSFFSMLSTSHPLPDPSQPDRYLTFVSSLNPLPGGHGSIRAVRMGPSPFQRELVAEWPLDVPTPYMHSFAVTSRHAVFFACPVFVSIPSMLVHAEPLRSLHWQPEAGTHIYVVELASGRVHRLFSSDAFFAMHQLNAFEDDDGRLVVDLIAYPDLAFLRDMQRRVLTNRRLRDRIAVASDIRRFHIDLEQSQVSWTKINASSQDMHFVTHMDMPAINENYRYRRYCYAYGMALKSDGAHLANISLVKKDVCGGGGDRAWHRANHYASEPWFVERPGATDEDDGVLLDIILDGERRRSYLGIFDARSMQLINSAYLPTFVPFTLHGRFFNDL